MKILKKSVPLWVVIVSVVALTGVAIAAIIITWDISTQLEITGVWGITCYEWDKTTELPSIDFGFLHPEDVKRYPTANYYYIVNTGDYEFWVSYTIINAPPSTDVTIEVFVGNGETKLSPDTVYTGKSLVPNDDLVWFIKISVSSTAAFASYNPTLRWNAHDSSTG